jgi:hypothetical protein
LPSGHRGSQDWEKSADAAFEKAAKERKPVLVLFQSAKWKTGRLAEQLLKTAAGQKAAKGCICVKVNVDAAQPAWWPSALDYRMAASGGVILATAGSSEFRWEYELQQAGADGAAAWIAETADRLAPPWETSPFAAETRAKREGWPLLIAVGTDKEVGDALRDPALRDALDGVVVLKVASESKRYEVPGTCGGVMIDPSDRKEIVSWPGVKRAAEIKGLVEKPLAEWRKGAAERRRTWEAANPFVCAFCGHRGGGAESCCGETMVKPEPALWEKTFEEAKKRAVVERRAVVYVVLRSSKELSAVQELFAEPRLAALASRSVLVAEEASEAGGRPKELGGVAGVVILGSRDGKGEPSVQVRLAGMPGTQDLARELAGVVRKLRLGK